MFIYIHIYIILYMCKENNMSNVNKVNIVLLLKGIKILLFFSSWKNLQTFPLIPREVSKKHLTDHSEVKKASQI